MKRIVNEKYFENINHNSAYIIGFILGDGNISKNDSNNYYLNIRIHEKDKEILEFISKELTGEIQLSHYSHTQKSGLITNYVGLKITSNNLCKPLISLGITPNKTGKERFPALPNKYIPDFLRGYFDADGSIAIKKQTNYVFSYTCANKKMLEDIQNYFKCGKIENGHGNCYTYYVSNLDDILKIGKILYNSRGFYLKRKKERFDSMPKKNRYLAFGEYKTLAEWSKDSRCCVHRDTLLYRINNTSLSTEDCITLKPKSKIGDMYSRNKKKTRKHKKNNYEKL